MLVPSLTVAENIVLGREPKKYRTLIDMEKAIREDVYKRQVLDDDMVLRAMDHEGSGAFIPVGRTSTGRLRKSKKLADLEKLGHIERRIEDLVRKMAAGLYAGGVDARPLVKQNSRPCD